MATISTKLTNGVSFGYRHTVTSSDVSDGYVIIDFQVDYDLAAIIQIVDGDPADVTQSSPVVSLGDAEISYPDEGQVRIANGDSTFTLVAGYVISVVAQRASDEDE